MFGCSTPNNTQMKSGFAQHKEKGSPSVLVIGSVNIDNPARKLLGGTVVSLQCLINELRKRPDLELHVLDIAASKETTRPLEDIGRAIHFIKRVVTEVFRVDVVSLHSVSSKLWFTGIVTLVVSRFACRPVVIRKFDGTDYGSFPFWKKVATKWVLSRCDVYLAQTKHLVEVAKTRDQIMHCFWFPTHRPMNRSLGSLRDRSVCRRFVYVGQVRAYKGIMELVQATERLNGDVTVDVYGPMFDDLPPDLFKDRSHISYKGVLDRQDVVRVMQQYDASVLPTKANTEGYPGAIIESYAAGLPVIATACGAISEIVSETSGILIEPGSVETLYQAMKKLSGDSELYAQLCRGAAERAGEFSAGFWADRFVTYCLDLIVQKRQ